jgi:hypothetical protein
VSPLAPPASPLARPIRLVAVAIGIYFVSWVCWALLVYFGFGRFMEWSQIHAREDWMHDPAFFQKLLALPPLIPVLVWGAIILGRRGHPSDQA